MMQVDVSTPGTMALAGPRFAILPDPAQERFTLRNRASLTMWLRAKRIMLMTASDTGALAGAGLVLLADPRQAELVRFCGPGTRIVEIAPDGWAGNVCRTLCAELGIGWQLMLGSVPCYPLLQPLPFGTRVPMSYEIPIARLNQTLKQLGL